MHRAIRHGQQPPPAPRIDPPSCPSWCTGFCVAGANHRSRAVSADGATAHLSAPRTQPRVVTVTTDRPDPPMALLLAIAELLPYAFTRRGNTAV